MNGGLSRQGGQLNWQPLVAKAVEVNNKPPPRRHEQQRKVAQKGNSTRFQRPWHLAPVSSNVINSNDLPTPAGHRQPSNRDTHFAGPAGRSVGRVIALINCIKCHPGKSELTKRWGGVNKRPDQTFSCVSMSLSASSNMRPHAAHKRLLGATWLGRLMTEWWICGDVCRSAA